MTVIVAPGRGYEAVLTNAPPDLLGHLGFQVTDPTDQTIKTPRRTDGISIVVPGVYVTFDVAPIIEGSYLIIWDYEGTTASEELVATTSPIANTPSSDGYATVADVRIYAPELATYEDETILAEIHKAERDIDWYAGFSGEFDEATGLKFVPLSALDLRYANAITKATCAQVQYRIYMGPAFTVDEMQYPEVQGRDQTVQKPQRMGPAARSEFPIGLRKLTGRFA